MALGRLSLRQLALISAIEDNGSLKRAAEAIGMSQPRATKALQEAEQITGKRLFQRSNRGLTATVAGTCAIRNARTILAQLGKMERELNGLALGRGSRLRIGTIMGAVPYVTEIIQQHLERYPDTSVEILEDTSAELLRQLDRGALDMVIGRHSVSSAEGAYRATPFHDELLRVVANPNHPLCNQKRIQLQDLKNSRWIVYTAAMPMRLLLEKEFQDVGLEFPDALIETRSALTTMALIQGDPETVALLSDDVAAFFVNFQMARTLPLQLRSKSEPYEVITHRSQDVSDEAKLFIAQLVAGASPEN